jgi:leucyl aminopeptidase (aminopeptidase T)
MAPLHDSGINARLSSKIPFDRKGLGRCILMIFEKDTMSHNEAVRQAFSNYKDEQYQVIRTINSGADLFSIGLKAPPETLSALNSAVLEECLSASSLTINTEGGSELHVELDNSRFHWISNRGIAHPGKFMVLPAGEVATYPASVAGILVADFAINVNTWMEQDARLDTTPVTVEIINSEIVNLQCENPKTRKFLNGLLSRKNAKKVGELGFGTNPFVRRPVFENSHLNERTPGIHLGFGQHNQTVEATGYFCDIHVDLIAKGGVIRINETNRSINLSNIQPSCAIHPSLAHTQDIFSGDDCCGLFATDKNRD